MTDHKSLAEALAERRNTVDATEVTLDERVADILDEVQDDILNRAEELQKEHDALDAQFRKSQAMLDDPATTVEQAVQYRNDFYSKFNNSSRRSRRRGAHRVPRDGAPGLWRDIVGQFKDAPTKKP
jgi:hypothetical protein